MTINNVAFIGLGVMGYPMAGHLKKNNYNVTVYNRTRSKAEKWLKEYSGLIGNTPGEASKDSQVVFTCVGRDEDLREVMEGSSGILKNIKSNTIIVDHTTASANIAREYYDICKSKGNYFLDSPVSGGQAGAENGKLSIMIGGDYAPYSKVKQILEKQLDTILINESNSVYSPLQTLSKPPPAFYFTFKIIPIT